MELNLKHSLNDAIIKLRWHFMFYQIYQNLPLHLSPIAFMIGPFAVRWYALSYIVGFFTVYFLLLGRIKKGELNWLKSLASNHYSSLVLDFMLLIFFASLVGGRIGYALFYNGSYFASHPLAVFSPYENGNYVGFFGMSYHGALIAAVVAGWIFLRQKNINFFAWADFIVPAIPLGYFFGRIGNFLNGELYGRVTNAFWGMHFIGQASVLRYPSQFIEALTEGLLLFAILWPLRNKKYKQGTLFALYLIGYGLARIFSEQFREPDPQLGFIFGHVTRGQILSLAMIVSGSIIVVFHKKTKSGILN